MIAVCPKCTARYRVADEQLAKGELRLRCTRCEAVFRVRAPSPAPVSSPSPARPPVAAAASLPPADANDTVRGQPRVAAGEEGAANDDRPRVLVADPDPETGKRIAARVASFGLVPLLAHDGVEALLLLQRRLPAAAVLDASLRGIPIAALCEVVKRNAELRAIRLVVATEPALRSDRSGADGFEPDRTIAADRLDAELEDILRGFGLPIAPPPRPAAASLLEGPPGLVSPAPAPPRAALFVPAPAPPADDPLGAERAKAERLARIIVSDVVLYNEEKFTRAVAEGRVLERMEEDLAEGRTLFRQRIDARVREERDFLGDELLRVAGTRGARGSS